MKRMWLRRPQSCERFNDQLGCQHVCVLVSIHHGFGVDACMNMRNVVAFNWSFCKSH